MQKLSLSDGREKFKYDNNITASAFDTPEYKIEVKIREYKEY